MCGQKPRCDRLGTTTPSALVTHAYRLTALPLQSVRRGTGSPWVGVEHRRPCKKDLFVEFRSGGPAIHRGPPSWAAHRGRITGHPRAAHEGGPLYHQRSSGPPAFRQGRVSGVRIRTRVVGAGPSESDRYAGGVQARTGTVQASTDSVIPRTGSVQVRTRGITPRTSVMQACSGSVQGYASGSQLSTSTSQACRRSSQSAQAPAPPPR